MRLNDFIAVYEKCEPHVEPHVYTVGVVDAGSRDLRRPLDVSLGSAFAVSSLGHYLTAFHVISKEYEQVRAGKRLLALKGFHRTGPEKAFGVQVLEVYKRSDIALLKGPPRQLGYISTASAPVRVGAWVATVGYPLSYFDDERGKVMIDKRFVSAMISAAFNNDGVRSVELDKHLSHGHSGGPIITLEGVAIALTISNERGWDLVPERVKDGEEWTEKRRIFRLPVQFSKGTMLQNVGSRLGTHGVPIQTIAPNMDEPDPP